MKKLNRILLIDDDEANNFLNQMLIEDLNLAEHISVALNGQIALDILNTSTLEPNTENSFPELMLVDINMPVMDGFEFLEAYNNMEVWKNKCVLICMLTSSLNPTDKKRSENISSINEYIPKPLTEEAIKEIWNKYF